MIYDKYSGMLCDPSTCDCYCGCLSALGNGSFPEDGKSVCGLANMKMPDAETMLKILDLVKTTDLVNQDYTVDD